MNKIITSEKYFRKFYIINTFYTYIYNLQFYRKFFFNFDIYNIIYQLIIYYYIFEY